MTKILMNIKPDSVYMDCINHANNHDVCTIISTLCNVCVAECIRNGISPKIYEDGHVLIDAVFADKKASEVFEAVALTLSQVAEEHPTYVRIY